MLDQGLDDLRNNSILLYFNIDTQATCLEMISFKLTQMCQDVTS